MTNSFIIEFSVDGSKLPGFDFELDESYAGLLPTNEGNGELFFWFFPSSNVSATDDVVIWINGGVRDPRSPANRYVC